MEGWTSYRVQNIQPLNPGVYTILVLTLTHFDRIYGLHNISLLYWENQLFYKKNFEMNATDIFTTNIFY